MARFHEVKQGDCVSSVAFESGLTPDLVWDDANNADLKSKRKDPNVLLPGDRLSVPDVRVKEVSEPTNQVHKFTFKGAPAKLNLRLLDDGEPLANLAFVIEIDGVMTEGRTDSDGRIRASIVPNAKTAKVTVEVGGDKRVFKLDLGWLDPIDEVPGIKKRLYNLGYDVGVLDARLTPQLEEAIMDFEFDQGLERRGKITDEIKAKLVEAYGC